MSPAASSVATAPRPGVGAIVTAGPTAELDGAPGTRVVTCPVVGTDVEVGGNIEVDTDVGTGREVGEDCWESPEPPPPPQAASRRARARAARYMRGQSRPRVDAPPACGRTALLPVLGIGDGVPALGPQ